MDGRAGHGILDSGRVHQDLTGGRIVRVLQEDVVPVIDHREGTVWRCRANQLIENDMRVRADEPCLTQSMVTDFGENVPLKT